MKDLMKVHNDKNNFIEIKHNNDNKTLITIIEGRNLSRILLTKEQVDNVKELLNN